MRDSLKLCFILKNVIQYLLIIQGTTSALLIGGFMGIMFIMGATITSHGVGTMQEIIGTTVMVCDFLQKNKFTKSFV